MFIVAAPPSVRQGGNFLMSKTPETDAMCICTQHKSFKATGGVVNPDFARRLECERDDAKLLLEKEVSAHANTILDLQEKEDEVLEQARLLGMGAEREAKLIAERDLWKAEAEKWRQIAIDLDGHTDEAIKRLKWRQDNLERGIKELKG
jgi:hypothetical protein